MEVPIARSYKTWLNYYSQSVQLHEFLTERDGGISLGARKSYISALTSASVMHCQKRKEEIVNKIEFVEGPKGGLKLTTWKEIESTGDKNGWIRESIYKDKILDFRICPVQDPAAAEAEARVWKEYLSATRKNNTHRLMYHELYRYEFYEGRKRTGFWGNIEDAIRKMPLGESPKITIFSAGTGRELIKIGLAAGIWESTAPLKIRGTHKEVSPEYLRLVNPKVRIMITEYESHILKALVDTVKELLQRGLLLKEMVTVRRWNFRYRAPLATASQDLVVFALVGNYAKFEEQPLILTEVSRCVKKGSYLVASTMLPELDFSKARRGLKKIRLIFTNPLAWPILKDFLPWQVEWAKMAGEMNKAGYWQNVPAKVWMEFLEKVGMGKVKIYPAPSSVLPVEVLVVRKR